MLYYEINEESARIAHTMNFPPIPRAARMPNSTARGFHTPPTTFVKRSCICVFSIRSVGLPI